MGFWSLFVVASAPVEQFLLVGLLGAFLASSYSNLLTPDARRDINKVVFQVFTPSLIFASLAKSVTAKEILSWWFMPVNIGLTFFAGAVLGWIVVKVLKPAGHLEGLVVATCCSGNLGNLMLIIVPALCNEEGNPFSDRGGCSSRALSYVSFSMALGSFYIWTITFNLVKKSSSVLAEMKLAAANGEAQAACIGYDDRNSGDGEIEKLGHDEEEAAARHPSAKPIGPTEHNSPSLPLLSNGRSSGGGHKAHPWGMLKETMHQLVEEFKSPPIVGAVIGFFVGATPWLKSLIVGEAAPLHVVFDSLTLLGQGTLPCITLILGGNLTKGIGKSVVKPAVIAGIICVRCVLLPVVGIGIVKAAGALGFLPGDPLYSYVLLIQFALPPAMAIGTMAQLFQAGQEECSVIFLWTYLSSTLSLSLWSFIFMSILS